MKINSTSFGNITIDKKQYQHDILFDEDKIVGKRSKSRSERINGHRELAQVEIEDLLISNPEILILGMGQYGRLPMKVETENYLTSQIKERAIKLIKGKTPDIIDKVNEALDTGKSIAGLIHVTC